MCKIDLKGALFSVPLHKDSQKLVRFLWEEDLYEFLCQCFGLELAPRIFLKLLKIPISVVRHFIIRVISYLDNWLILGNSMNKICMARNSVIFLLQYVDFAINLKKCVLDPAQEIVRIDCEFSNYDFLITNRKANKDKGSMPEALQVIRSISSGFGKTNRNTFFNHSNSARRLFVVLLPTATAKYICKTNTV